MNLTRLLFFLLTVAVLTSAVTYFYHAYEQQPPKGTRVLPYLFSVNDTVGVDVGTDIFRLGQLQPGSSSSRALTISETISSADLDGKAKRFRIEMRGKGSEWMEASPVEVSVPGSVNISVSVPVGAPYGYYRGSILVIPVN
jgi:hypothetical protein